MPKPKLAVSPAVKRNLASFKSKHDPSVSIPAKIRAALARMAKEQGPEAYAYEFKDSEGGVPFATQADVSAMYLSQFRSQFADHVVSVPPDIGSKRSAKKVWFATVKAALAARGGPPTSADVE